MLDVRARKNVSRAVDPIARVVARLGLSPTAITLIGATFAITGAALISLGYLAIGCGVMGFGALLDILDGVLARLTGTETIRGALLDSFTDRVGEIAVWSGLAYYLGKQGEATLVMLTILGICGSLVIPYVRAKAEAFGVEGKGGWMGRAERLLVFGFGVGLSEFWPSVLEYVLWGLGALIWLTVIQRFARTWKQLEA
ncbi:MAG: CDP-alcohol phosphatidyltransferase family protein [Actinobacteria bacterium]|nr:CDP-alcohol phosphatidyltransferase family protein [Actinomycetota bacterium]